MAQGKCRDCGHEMSTTAKECPNCGCTLPAKEKKIRTITCPTCKGTGYYYTFRTNYYGGSMKVPGCSALGYSNGNENKTSYISCEKNHNGALKCFCNDGQVEELYYSD